jgi:hypothetical protein
MVIGFITGNDMDYVEDLKGILALVEETRRPLCEKADILRNTIMRESQNEWIKGESPRCKRERAIVDDCRSLREVRDAIETIIDNRHLIDEPLAKRGEFSKKYEQIG